MSRKSTPENQGLKLSLSVCRYRVKIVAYFALSVEFLRKVSIAGRARMHDILKKLDGGDLRSIGRSNEVAEDILNNPKLFPIVFEGMLTDNPIIRMRAADAVEKVSSRHPEYLEPLKERLIKEVSKTEQQEVRWHVAQMFSYLRLEASEREVVVKILQKYINDESKIVKAFAIQTLAEIAEKDEDYRPFVISTIRRLTSTGSAAVKARGQKLLKKLTADKGES